MGYHRSTCVPDGHAGSTVGITTGKETAIRSTPFDLPIVGHALVIAAALAIPSLAAAGGAADATAPARTTSKAGDVAEHRQRGNASFYSKHLTGRKTASGERYDPGALTAAHRTLPLGTQVRVVNPRNDRSVVVTVNDRGPVPKNRMIDVSGAAADELGMKKSGVTRVETQVVGRSDAQQDTRTDAPR